MNRDIKSNDMEDRVFVCFANNLFVLVPENSSSTLNCRDDWSFTYIIVESMTKYKLLTEIIKYIHNYFFGIHVSYRGLLRYTCFVKKSSCMCYDTISIHCKITIYSSYSHQINH